jgi:hypothetical protein
VYRLRNKEYGVQENPNKNWPEEYSVQRKGKKKHFSSTSQIKL